MWMCTLEEIRPRPTPDHGEIAFWCWPRYPRWLMWHLPAAIDLEGAALLWACGKQIDPAYRVIWLNDVAIALRHGCPLSIALGLARYIGSMKPLWKRGHDGQAAI